MGIRSKETSVAGAVIAAVCIVIYIGALVQASVRFYLSIEKSGITADDEFNAITTLAISDGVRGFMDDRFKDTINNALAASKSLEALIISGPEGEYAFERQKGYAVNWVNNSPRFINRLSFSNKSHYRPLPINGLRNANIKAVARAFDYFELSKILKETLLLIIIGFAVSFFTMLLQFLKTKPAAAGKVPSSVDEKVSVTKKSQDDIEIDNIETEPKGLYSPRSNIGWEEYIKDRLDSELHRCASTENDLTLIFMDFTNITSGAMYKQAAEEAIAFFTSRDLLFEYGNYGICAILPGISLEAGISKAEKFYLRVTEKLPDSKSAESLRIGISSRSGRLLNADRLMMEVREALNKSKKELKSSIIAFKSDLDKYRAFIANNS